MATTPEGRVKKQVKLALNDLVERGYRVWYYMPVQNGMGKPVLDFIGTINGKFFAIETKAPGKQPTQRQLDTIAEMRAAGAAVIVFHGEPGVLGPWLVMLSA